MNKKNQMLADEEIDLRKIILTLWKEKFLIFIITLIFTVTGYIYGAKQSKVYQLTFVIRQAPSILFEKYKTLLANEYKYETEKKQSIDLASAFNEEFNINLTSQVEIINFVIEKKKLNELKSYIKKNNVNTSNFIEDEFITKISKVKNIPNTYTFNFQEQVSGREFLNDYVIYVKKITEKIFIEQVSEIIQNEIEIINQYLDIEKKNNLEYPIRKIFDDDTSALKPPKILFYSDIKELFKQKILLEKILKQTKDLTFKYNPVADGISNEYLISKSPFEFAVVGLIIGMFFYIVIFFIRKLFK